MPKKTDRDLFRESTMTFGEHLEELRGCLFRALLWLVGGFLIGLAFAEPVMEFIQTPLRNALATHYKEEAKGKLEALAKSGVPLPGTIDQLTKLVAKEELLPEVVYVEPRQLLVQLGQTELPSGDPELRESDLVQVFLWKPLAEDRRIQAKSLNAPEPFMIFVKAALLVGVLVASPGIFYNIWSFVASGLYHHERRFVYVYGPFSLILFFAGAALVFFFVFQIVLGFLFSFNTWLGIGIEPRITDWLSFALILPLGFGIAFQLPLVMLFLERIGVFDVRAYVEKWRIAILVIFILSMLLTPADPGSMLLMAIPLTVLYFGGVLLCKYMPRSRRRHDEDFEDDFEE